MNTNSSIHLVESNQAANETNADSIAPSFVSLTLPMRLNSEEVFDLYWAASRKQQEHMEATAAVQRALLGVFEQMEVKELTIKGALFALKDDVPGVTEETVQACCETNPLVFEYLPPHGLRKATVRRVVEKAEKRVSDTDTAQNVETVVRAITEEPNKGASYYKPKLGLTKEQWQTAIERAVRSGAIDKTGERSNTVYFPKAA